MIWNLSKNKEIVILKQDKDRGAVVLDHSKYMGKCLSVLSTSQFAEIDHDPTAYIEGKVQRTLTKIKNKLHQLFIVKFIQLDHHPGSSMGLPNYIKFQTIAKLNSYYLDQSSLISERRPTIWLST